MLRLGGNEDDTRMVIAAAFQKQKSTEDIAALLQSTFHGGNGFKTPEGELSAWYAVDGIHIAPGRSAEHVRSAQVIAWQNAAARISELMDSGAYASNVELAEAGQHERMQLAQALWYLKHDLSDEAREQGYLSCMDTLRGGGFPDETARLISAIRYPASSRSFTPPMSRTEACCDSTITSSIKSGRACGTCPCPAGSIPPKWPQCRSWGASSRRTRSTMP